MLSAKNLSCHDDLISPMLDVLDVEYLHSRWAASERKWTKQQLIVVMEVRLWRISAQYSVFNFVLQEH
jgi:hypothetical protein